jgi:hypothetical protein
MRGRPASLCRFDHELREPWRLRYYRNSKRDIARLWHRSFA